MPSLRARGLTMGSAAALAAAAAGCGAQDAAQHAERAIDPVAQAASVTNGQQGGVAVSMRGAIDAAGHDVPLRGTGVVDRRGHSGKFTMTTVIAGKAVKMDEVMAGKVLYLRSDLFKGKLPGGKAWMKLDLRKAAAQRGIDLDALGGNATQDPAQVLDYLKGAGTSRKVGTATVAGTQTTQYHVDVDLRKVAARTGDPAARSSVDKLIAMIGTATIPVDVWVDAKHLVRRERMSYQMTIQNQKATFDMTVDFTRFGVAVDVRPPSDQDAVDLSKLAGGASGTAG